MPQLTRKEWGDIQALIVYGYLRMPFARYLLLHVTNAVKARAWLKTIAEHIMTVEKWDAAEGVEHPPSAINIAFTAPGLKALGLREETLDSFSREFVEGMAPLPKKGDQLHPRSIILGDTEASAPENWEFGRALEPDATDRSSEIHILVFVNGESEEKVAALLTKPPFDRLGDASGLQEVTSRQEGQTPPTAREPFGFRDGISNPWIEGTRYSSRHHREKGPELKVGDQEIVKGQNRISLKYDPVIRTGEFILGYENEYGQIPATPLIEPKDDPDGILPKIEDTGSAQAMRDLGRNGSYLVWRKLEENVVAFWEYFALHAKCEDGSVDESRMEWLAGKAVGRWPSGVPMTKYPQADNPQLILDAIKDRNNSYLNDFGYTDDDRDGYGCPVGAHCRRMNPRDSLYDDMDNNSLEERLKNANRHRLMRRGASWGPLLDHQVDHNYYDHHKIPDYHKIKEQLQGKPIGIHFFAVNANIQQQFEFVQQAWGNSGKFNGLMDSKDVIMGDNAGVLPQQLPAPVQTVSAQAATKDIEPAKYAEQNVEDFARQQPSHLVIPDHPVRQRLRNLPRFVTVRGGAYFFLPSMTALRYLAALK